MNNKLGLVLEGGAAKCAYQVGVLQALNERGIVFDGIAGTSMGALNGISYVQGGFKGVNKVWDDIVNTKFFDISDDMISRFKKKDFDIDMLFYAGKKLTSLWEEIRTSYQIALEYIAKNLNEEKVRGSEKDFGLVTYNMTDMSPVEVMVEDIPNGYLYEYLIASTSFPIFPPQIINGKKYIDGSVCDNLPITLLNKNGYKRILAVRIQTAQKPPKRKIDNLDCDIYYIQPESDLGLNMSFSTEHINELRKRGYEDTQRELQRGLAEFLGMDIED